MFEPIISWSWIVLEKDPGPLGTAVVFEGKIALKPKDPGSSNRVFMIGFERRSPYEQPGKQDEIGG